MITVRLLRRDEACIDAANRLLPQLSPGKEITELEFREALENPNFFILVAEDDTKTYPEKFVGMATIFFQRNLTRWIAEIHDVVVDRDCRGLGIRQQLTEKLLAEARSFAQAKQTKIKLYLTSRPSREAANQLYRNMGFTLVARTEGVWGTNLYKMIITP